MPSSRQSRRNSPRLRFSRGGRRRGAVLIVAMLVAALLAVVLGSYLTLNLTSSRLAKRTLNGYAALNLAEAGTEEAVWSFNRASANAADAWTGWTNNGRAAWQKFTNFELGANGTSWVKVHVDNFNPGPSARPRIVAQSSISAGNDTSVTRMIEVTLRRRSYFANGVVARENVVFSGSVSSVDSWNSDPDNDASTAPVPYSIFRRTARGTVASKSFVNQAVAINNAHIWGYVATGGGEPDVGPNGTIRGPGTPLGVAVDPDRVSRDFNADFPFIVAPLDGTPLAAVGATLGTAGAVTKWRIPGIVLNGSETLTILGDVTIVLTGGSGTDVLSLTGNAEIIIPNGSKLTIYAEGNIKVAGKGLGNSNAQPATAQLWGTNTTEAGQDIQVAGNGALNCVLYAPMGDVKINGNGDIMGSVIARNITFVGNAAFHYDESLAVREGNEPFSIGKWRELTTAEEQAAFAPLFQGW